MNIDLAVRTMQHIEAHPDKWDQSIWFDTATDEACFGGRALLIAKGWGWASNVQQLAMPFITQTIIERACGEVLDIAHDEGEFLFHETQTDCIDTMWRALHVVDSRIVVPTRKGLVVV